MSLIPYKRTVPQNVLIRSRSLSFSSPIRNRMIYQEMLSVGSNTLLRSYSCDHVFSKDVNGQSFQATRILVSSFLMPNEKKFVNVEHDVSNEEECLIDPRSKMQQRNESNIFVSETEMGRNVFSKLFKGNFLECTVLFLLSLLVYYCFVRNIECSLTWDLAKTKLELYKHVFGQNDALAKINTILELSNSTKEMHTMVFTGGVGVGKTYSTSIILHNFPWTSSQLLFSKSFNTDVQQILKTEFSYCTCNLVIVDDLGPGNEQDAVNLISALSSKRKSNQKLLTILIFQISTEDERKAIVNKVRESAYDFVHVPFKTLNLEAIEKCFLVEMKRQGVHIPAKELMYLVQAKQGYDNITKRSAGCKGIYEEVTLYSQNHA